MATIPEVRDQMLQLSEAMTANRITKKAAALVILVLEAKLYRRPQHHRGGRERNPRPDPMMIRAHAAANVYRTHAQLAADLNTNSGRISEALHGRR